MILLGENTDGLIASELLKPSREEITVFCGVPRKEMATLFRKTEQVATFQDFSKSTFLRPYCRKNYEIERKGILEGYREVIHGILGTEGSPAAFSVRHQNRPWPCRTPLADQEGPGLVTPQFILPARVSSDSSRSFS
ncbi:MAG: hypothetical protein VX417_04575 [SAR324 cluster bacterium]|nr:hypothetical protein [SAR324 cluster bacterium]